MFTKKNFKGKTFEVNYSRLYSAIYENLQYRILTDGGGGVPLGTGVLCTSKYSAIFSLPRQIRLFRSRWVLTRVPRGTQTYTSKINCSYIRNDNNK